MIILQSKKAKALSGANNKRLTKHRPTNNAQTAAWADIDKLKPESKVSIPSLSNVEEAKEWVDDGSRL
ncbi:DUF3787 domain-containing protein [Romboutsia lituseburensis]|uniref:DUF3787 domain-containing protein n=1 Tax=Romboutsia lituseburensis TaxID=1537 RepID=UPI002FE57E13